MAKDKLIGTTTLNGKPLKYTDSWDKMTFAQHLRVIKMKDIFDKISIITGIDRETIKKAKIKGLDKILYAAKFLDEQPKFPDKPTKIGAFKLPLNSKGIFDIQFESLEQFEDMRQVFSKLKPIEPSPDIIDRVYAHTEAYATYCAIYLQKLRDGEYDGDKALQMVPEIMNYPTSEVISAGGFFFVRLQSLSNGTRSNSPNTRQAPKKSIGKRSKRNLVRTRPLTRRQGR